MAKILTLSNGVGLAFTDESTVENMVNVLNSFADVDNYANNLSNDTLRSATFDGQLLENVVFVELTARKDQYGNVMLKVTNRYKTDLEILEDTQAEQDDVINYLLMNSEA